ncbi:MAG TPA: ABC transporter permease, partial [Blastocatellia bacterium]
VEDVETTSHGERGFKFVEEFLQDLLYGWRVLCRNPGFTIVVVLMLGLGVGANTAVFSLVDKLLLRSLPVREPDRLVAVSAESINPKFMNTIFSYPDYLDYQEQNLVFDGIAAYSDRQVSLGRDDGARLIRLSLVSSNYFQVLGADITGQGLPGSETSPRAAAEAPADVAIISQALWTSLGADPAIIGKPIVINDRTFTIVGIAAKQFVGPILEAPVDAWVPLGFFNTLFPGQAPIASRRNVWLRLLARLKQGVSEKHAQVGLDSVAQQVFQATTPLSDRGLPFNEKHILLEPGGKGSSLLRANLGPALKLMTAVVALLLIIACANIASLILARSAAHRKEIAIRLALGARRGRLARMLLVQNGILAIPGALAGLALAPWLHGTLLAFQPGFDLNGNSIESSLDLRVLAFTAVVTSICGLAFGLTPLFSFSRPRIVSALKDEVQTVAYRKLNVRSALVVSQVALAVLLLTGAGLLIRSLRNLLAIDPGFSGSSVLIVSVELKNKSPEARTQFYNSLQDRVHGLPGVNSVSTAQLVPLTGSFASIFIGVEGAAQGQGSQVSVDYNVVGPGYHELAGIPILEGRGLTEQDADGSQPVVIVNQSFARAFFPTQDAIGKHIKLGTNGPWIEIAGIAHDVKSLEITEASKPHIDLPALQQGYTATESLLVHATGNPLAPTGSIRGVIRELDPTARTHNPRTLDQILNDSIAPARMASTLTGIFALIALLLAVVGLYGIMAYAANQRKHEIGIRVALGASRPRIISMMLAGGGALVIAGIGLGVGVGIVATHIMSNLLYGVPSTDIASYSGAVIAVTLSGLLACYVPAQRSAKSDPMTALRRE